VLLSRALLVVAMLGDSKIVQVTTLNFDQSLSTTIVEIDTMRSIREDITRSFFARLAAMDADGARVATR
jgi:hypothetical protein